MDAMLEMLRYIQSFSNPMLDWFFDAVTRLGEDLFSVFMIAIIYWCINKSIGYKLAFVYLTSGAINNILKEIVKFPRPIGYEGIKSSRLETAGGYSFPSGHAQKSTSLFATLMIEFKKKWLYFIGITVILLVAFSRMYLGVHWPIDVIGGLIIGILWTIITVKIFDWSKDKGDPTFLGILVIPLIIGLPFFQTTTYYRNVGALVALWIGYMIEEKYIHYRSKAIWWKQIIKLVIGFLCLISIRVYFKKLLPQNIYSDFLRYAMMGIWMTVLSPMIYRI